MRGHPTVRTTEEVADSYTRFREQSFFTDECLDLLAAAADDPGSRSDLSSRARHEWLDDIMHQRRVLEEMSHILLTWDSIAASSSETKLPTWGM